jgi:hypothetical protein
VNSAQNLMLNTHGIRDGKFKFGGAGTKEVPPA